MSAIKEIVQTSMNNGMGTYVFNAIVEYRKKKFVISFTCYPDYFENHMELRAENIKPISSGVKITDACASAIRSCVRNYKLSYK